MDDVVKSKRTGHGEFFQIDRRAWSHLFETCGMHEAVAYLALARGAGGDNRTSSWSAKAINQRTSLSWRQGKEAIEKLISTGLVRREKGGTRPRYKIVPVHQIPGCESEATIALPPGELKLYNSLLSVERHEPGSWLGAKEVDLARLLVAKGYAEQGRRGYFRVADSLRPPQVETPPEWIWLPNALVDGVASETKPVELVRQSARPTALRLLVDLYDVQSMADYGGVHWRILRQEFVREKVGAKGPYTIWGFTRRRLYAWPSPLVEPYLTGTLIEAGGGKKQDEGWPIFWEALKILEQTGLIEFVEHIVDCDEPDRGAVLHPYVHEAGERMEDVGTAAREAARAMLNLDRYYKVLNRGQLLLPAHNHMADVQMVGLARPRYRARTSNTSQWVANQRKWEEWIRRYEKMKREAENDEMI
jgi:hypothetical protein